jgi:hypothetical protein
MRLGRIGHRIVSSATDRDKKRKWVSSVEIWVGFVVVCIFSMGHFPGKGALGCLDIILMKNKFEGHKIYV